jgi:hypothetical protein
MATTWSTPKSQNPPSDGAVRVALAACTTGTEAATAGANDGIDLRGLTAVEPHLEIATKATGTIRLVGCKPGDFVTVNGEVFTAVGKSTNPTAAQFKIGVDSGPDNGSDHYGAKNLAAAINADAAINGVLQAFADPNEAVVTIFAVADGAGGNALTLATSAAGRAVISGATLAGGAAAGVIGVGATLQASLLDPATGRWNRAPDLDLPLPDGAASAALPRFPVAGRASRLQYVPNGVGVACNVYLIGLAGRIP